jgi:hypothetical protein
MGTAEINVGDMTQQRTCRFPDPWKFRSGLRSSFSHSLFSARESAGPAAEMIFEQRPNDASWVAAFTLAPRGKWPNLPRKTFDPPAGPTSLRPAPFKIF